MNDTGKPLVSPRVRIHVHGDTEPVKPVKGIPFRDAGPYHVFCHIAVGSTNDLFHESSFRVLTCSFPTVSRQKVKGYPHKMIGEFVKVPVVQHLVS